MKADLNFWVVTICLLATWLYLVWHRPVELPTRVTVIDPHGQILGFALRADLDEAMLGRSHTVTIHDDGAP